MEENNLNNNSMIGNQPTQFGSNKNQTSEKEIKFAKTRKVSGIILASVLLASTLVGAGFGFAKSVDQVAGVDNRYNDFVQIEANVDFENGSTQDIKDASKSVVDTLNFLGMQNANVRTIGDDKIIINNPISSYSYFESNIMNDDETHFEDIMSATSNSNYFKEVGTLLIPLFFDGTLDIRDIEGDAAFVNKSTGGNDYGFVGGVENGGSFGVEAEPENPEEGSSYYSTTNRELGDEVDYVLPNFFESATLKHEQGLPLIELKIAKEGNNGDGYINMFKDLDRYIDSTANSENPTQYVFWFNYDLIYDLVDLIDPDGLSSSGSLYNYVAAKPNLRPLYVTTNSTSLMSSKYSDTVELRGTFTEKQARYFVGKINNSNSFKYNNIKFEVIINFQTKVVLLVLAIILLVLILVVIFSFVSYFGLLGVIASTVYLLSAMTITLIVSGTGILITGLGLVSLGVVFMISALIMFVIVNEYKTNNKDKFISVNMVASDKLASVHSILFAPIVVAVLLFYGAGLILTTAIAIPLYIIIIGVVLSYVFASVLLFPIVYAFDLLIEWTRTTSDKKWDYVYGFNSEYQKGHEVKLGRDKTKAGTIVAIVMMAVSVIVGGTLYFTTGSAFNTTNYGTQNYSYVVEATDEIAKMKITQPNTDPFDTSENRFAADLIYTHFQATEEHIDEVEKAFKDNGVKVSSIEVIRNDEITQPYGEDPILLGSFGFEVNSRTKIDEETASKVNASLGEIEAVLNEEEIAGLDATTSFKLAERMSWDGSTSNSIRGYQVNQVFINGIWTLLLMIFISSVILIFVGNLGVGISTLISSIMELALLVSPMVIFYLPISTLSVFTIVLMFGISLVLKTLIVRDAKGDEIELNKWERAADKRRFVIPVFAGVLLILELFLIGVYSWTIVLPMLLITILAPIGIFLVQQFIFPSLTSKMDINRNNQIRARLQADIEESKNAIDGEPREEYIVGVNM